MIFKNKEKNIFYKNIYVAIVKFLIFFKTLYLGDTPTPPGIPILKYFKKNSYEITWQSSQNNGLDTLIYELEGKSKTESEQNERNNTETQQYTNWTLLHNGTGFINFLNIKILKSFTERIVLRINFIN